MAIHCVWLMSNDLNPFRSVTFLYDIVFRNINI